jgi:hypothetical protein
LSSVFGINPHPPKPPNRAETALPRPRPTIILLGLSFS